MLGRNFCKTLPFQPKPTAISKSSRGSWRQRVGLACRWARLTQPLFETAVECQTLGPPHILRANPKFCRPRLPPSDVRLVCPNSKVSYTISCPQHSLLQVGFKFGVRHHFFIIYIHYGYVLSCCFLKRKSCTPRVQILGVMITLLCNLRCINYVMDIGLKYIFKINPY
jgi:hypothetical protein